jgi:hypothetical protein
VLAAQDRQGRRDARGVLCHRMPTLGRLVCEFVLCFVFIFVCLLDSL